MSYLGYPRLHFIGSFRADPPTVNNDPSHYDNDRFVTRFQRRQSGMEMNGWWNPDGTGAWELRGCQVGTVLASTDSATQGLDDVLGGWLTDADERPSAKMVDLDPGQQTVSEIWGLNLRLHDRLGRPVFAGEVLPSPLADIWARHIGGRPDGFFGAMYQSVLTDVRWFEGTASPFAEELRMASPAGLLSIKFNVDGFDDDFTSPNFGWGRIVGSIGPYQPGEPRHVVFGRPLRPVGPGSLLNTAQCLVDRSTNVLSIDLGNSLPTLAPGGPLLEVGPISLACLAPDRPLVTLAVLPSVTGGFYEQYAGILSVPLTPDQVDLVDEGWLALMDRSGTVLLAESPDGTFVRADDVVFRMDPSSHNKAATTIYVGRQGAPLPGATVALSLAGPQPGLSRRGPVTSPAIGVPPSALSFPETVTTDAEGRCEVPLTALPPGNPRGWIDGQVYLVNYGVVGSPSPSDTPLSILVWDDYPVPERPTWVDHVQPILQQYANLYPAMRNVVDLSDYHQVVSRRPVLELALNLPPEDPNHMPVSRDLSPGKRATVLKWLSEPRPLVLDITDTTRLQRALQLAVKLEHATIPPYLAALFSMDQGSNIDVSRILREIVVQEMVHMGLVCNLLNAVGGAPRLSEPAFVPRYPSRLPAALRPDISVSLRRCSRDQIRLFMEIEKPEETIGGSGEAPSIDMKKVKVTDRGEVEQRPRDLLDRLEARAAKVEHNPFTIGWFYNQIARAIIALDQPAGALFRGDPARQLTPDLWPAMPGRLYKVTDRATALLALHEIVHQGEGTSALDPTDDRHEVAHYFRFQEIIEGRELLKTDGGKWVFEGPEVRFDSRGVLPMVNDPDTSALVPGSVARARAEVFDATYARLLHSLEQVVNGQPSLLRSAIGVMFSLEVEGRNLLRTWMPDGSPFVAGPSFQVS
jgi:hypothetical protein